MTVLSSLVPYLIFIGALRLLRELANYFYDRIVARTTALFELEELGTPRKGPRIRGTAVIAGGSAGLLAVSTPSSTYDIAKNVAGTWAVINGGLGIAGLYTARVCLDHFEKVLVVDPEAWLQRGEGTVPRFDVRGSPSGARRAVEEEERSDEGGEAVTKTIGGGAKRGRVAQYDALHAYQPFSLAALRKLFPGFDDAAHASDIRISPATDPAYASGILGRPLRPTRFHPFVPIPSLGLTQPAGERPNSIFCSREGLEILLRRLVFWYAGYRQLGGRNGGMKGESRLEWVVGSVVGVKQIPPLKERGEKSPRVGKVLLKRSGGEVEEEVDVTLLVDCTGVLQQGLRWLSSSSPTTDLSDFRQSYNPKMRYTCFLFAVPPSSRLALDALIPSGYPYGGEQLEVTQGKGGKTPGVFFTYFPDPKKGKRTVVFSRVEGHRVRVACGGWAISDAERPRTAADMKAFVQTASDSGARPIPPWVFEVLNVLVEGGADGVWDDEVAAGCDDQRVPPCSYLPYHTLPRYLLPSNFVAVGDATMRVNPIFGQGCTKACIGAVALNGVLVRHTKADLKMLDRDGVYGRIPDGFAGRYFEALEGKMDNIWETGRFGDYAFDTTAILPGESRDKTRRWWRKWSSLATRAAKKDDTVNAAQWWIKNFLAPPADLYRPEIVARILWRTFVG